MPGYNPTIPIGVPYGRTGPATAPFNTGPTLPVAGGGSFGSSVTNQFSQFGVGDILGAIGGAVGDVGGWIADHVPRSLIPAGAVDSSGDIDWTKVGLDALGGIANWLKANKSTIIDGLNAVNQYERSQKSDKYAQQALAGAKEAFDAKAPLRVAGQAGMLNPQANAPDLSGLKTQGQNGLSIKAPTPLPLATGNLANAQAMANGPGSSNPFTRTLPVAHAAPPPVAPPSTPPLGPTNVPPIGGITPPPTPQTPDGFTPLPVMPTGAPQLPSVPGAPAAPKPLPVYRPPQSGKIRMPGY